jgi:hypothetical protein
MLLELSFHAFAIARQLDKQRSWPHIPPLLALWTSAWPLKHEENWKQCQPMGQSDYSLVSRDVNRLIVKHPDVLASPVIKYVKPEPVPKNHVLTKVVDNAGFLAGESFFDVDERDWAADWGALIFHPASSFVSSMSLRMCIANATCVSAPS